MLDYDAELAQRIVDDIDETEAVLFIDSISLQTEQKHLNFILDFLLEKFQDKFQFFDDSVSQAKTEAKTKINLLGRELLENINEYDFKTR